jgi:hypothetical protein
MDGVFGELRAIGWDIDRHSYAPGDTVEASVWWTARGRPSADYDLVYRVIGPNGENLATAESRGAGDVFPASQWPAGSLMRDVVRLRLPGDLRAGDYRLQAGVRLDGATVVGAAPWSIAGFLTVR